MNLRTRLSLTFIAVVSPVLLLFLGNFYSYFELSKQEEFLIKLKNRAITMTHLLVEKRSINESLLRRIDEDTYTSYSDRRVAIFDQRNQLLYDSGELDNPGKIGPSFPITTTLLNEIGQQHEVAIKDGKRSGVGLLIHHQGQVFKVVSYGIDDYGIQKTKEAIFVSGASFVVAFLLVIALSRLFARRSIKPIANMMHQIDQITVSNLDTRLAITNEQDEIGRLALAFNQMLDRISAFELQRSFVSNASHELRTPLTLLTNQIEVALIKARSVEEYKQLLISLLEDINQLNALSNGLLELAQFDAKQIHVAWSPVELDGVLYEAVAAVLQKNPTYSVTLATDSSEESLPSIQVEGEESLLKTAFINLIENGCKFSSDHHARLIVQLRETDVKVDIEDKGIGIADSDLIYVFQPFYRSANARTIKGNGIGLSLTEKIIKLHGGSMSIQSALNEGTTFSVYLPHQAHKIG
ncbi:sensor histidine kinase [Spirosoma agri]|uniref:histidine kinase n=1 Tax=Spirosoma agri TaxID=1987381 RepID=A0A6M0INI6_9BACT|nr:ATP-binding protein [Spirosoma agri]NEU69644.1 HAMP domain-containing protein [Spirosoma agri]